MTTNSVTSANPNLLTASAAVLPDWARRATNLADPRIGASIVSCSDDFFAPAERMLQAGPAIFAVGKYDDNGKWMDGWESRRRRGPGHDWCVVALARPGTIAGLDIDTSFFTGNYAPAASVDGCLAGDDPAQARSWRPLLSTTALRGNEHHLLELPAAGGQAYSHVRLNIFPDGGVARLRVYGHVLPAAVETGADGLVDLSALVNGGRPLAWNDAHFGAVGNLLLPGRGVDMGDGWETRRRREPGNDWCIIALGLAGVIKRIEVDTAHFKGNYPDRVSLQGAMVGEVSDDAVIAQSMFWPNVLPEQVVGADRLHVFSQLSAAGVVSHVRFNLHPDGGVSRLRLWGTPAGGTTP